MILFEIGLPLFSKALSSQTVRLEKNNARKGVGVNCDHATSAFLIERDDK